MMRTAALTFTPLLLLTTTLWAGDPPKDRRLVEPPRHYDLKYFPWTPPATKEAWEARRPVLRQQVLVSQGLWPLPEKTPLRPIIHGKIERDGYTIEKVYFASYPGHYVTGNLYRPTGKTGKLPAVLNPHGHWANGRFYEASPKEVEKLLADGAEKTPEGARYPLQARQAQLARLGCVVFHYDMVGYADSKQIPHRQGMNDAQAELWLQNQMGLQTWNSIRALDFLTSLPDVDPSRVGVTGASGGGTQTFILCAVDDRPAAQFPAVMVSASMQGGCVCENSSYLRVGTTNIELAALWAPRPLGMAAALDWTRDIMTKGMPELKTVYKMYGAEENLLAEAYLQFGHNYNQVSRELMYNFFNRHLKLGHSSPIKEQPFVPVPPKELSVFDADHPLPSDGTDAAGLRRYLTTQSTKQMQALVPKDAKGVDRLRAVLGPALRTMIGEPLPEPAEVEEVAKGEREQKGDVITRRLVLSRKGQGERIPAVGLVRSDHDGRVVVWVHPDGVSSLWKDGQLVPEAKAILDQKAAILAVEVLRTGATAKEPRPPVNKTYPGYTFGYNRPLLAERVRDILTAVAYARGDERTKSVHLAGFEKAGPWVLLARGLCGDKVGRTVADVNQLRFEDVQSPDDENLLPGALKYGGLLTLASLAAPHELYLHNARGPSSPAHLIGAYQALGQADKLQRQDAKDASAAVTWLVR